MSRKIGYLYIALATLIFSFAEIALKSVNGIFDPLQLTMLRFLIGGLALIPFARQSLRKRGERLGRKDIARLPLTGLFCVTLGMVFYQLALIDTKASVVAVVFAGNPIFITAFAALFLGEKIYRRNIIALVFVVLGIVVIMEPWNAEAELGGIVPAILSALLFACYSVLGKRLSARVGGIVVTCGSFLMGSLELLALLLLGRTAGGAALLTGCGLSVLVDVPFVQGIGWSTLAAFAYICLINTAGGFVFHMLAMEKTSAQEASLVFFIKPALAPLLAWLILHEEITGNLKLGIVCFLIASAVSILPGLIRYRREKAQKTMA